jgi:TonB family protein
VANSGGGRIDVGEVNGMVRARTAGGSIGVLRVAGPSQIETTGGSIFLTQVLSPTRASTANGAITVRLATWPHMKLAGPMHFSSGQGDILVFVPRQMPVTFDAQIEAPGEHRIETDRDMPPIKVSYASDGTASRPVRGELVLNGGGELIKLRTLAGNIRLRYAESASQARWHAPDMQELMEKQLQMRMEAQLRMLEDQLRRQYEQQMFTFLVVPSGPPGDVEMSRLKEFRYRFEAAIKGRVTVPAAEQTARRLAFVQPRYPQRAREQKLEGVVRLEVLIDETGKVEGVRTVAGHPDLATAAEDAVRLWKYLPVTVGGRAVRVVTTVDVEFKLSPGK